MEGENAMCYVHDYRDAGHLGACNMDSAAAYYA